MKIDFAILGAKSNAAAGKIYFRWSGPKAIEIDEKVIGQAAADAVATVMGFHLRKGLRPDGSGPMPGRKSDGRPRGKGARITMALSAQPTGPRSWFIAAHREIQGHLARIMQDVPFRPPPLERISKPIQIAIGKAVRALGAAQGTPQAPHKRRAP